MLLEDDIWNPTEVEKLLRATVADSADFAPERVFDVTYPPDRARVLRLYRYLGPLDEPAEIPRMYLPIVGMEFEAEAP